nr:response regulator transcription factor [uncultured Shimia sp.]
MTPATVLIIDDDLGLSDEVSELLLEQGYSVEFARSRSQFSKLFPSSKYDLFIVDLLLPDGHGFEIIKEIREVSSSGIVVLSGKLEEVDKVVALELGADDYIIKPFARSEFVARIKSLLRRLEGKYKLAKNQKRGASEVKYGNWRTDVQARKLYAPDESEVLLTKLEFDIWLVFVQALERVFTREQLIYAVRGRDWAGYDRSIDGLVSRLRKKLSCHQTGDVQFETIRGIGYMLRSPIVSNTKPL